MDLHEEAKKENPDQSGTLGVSNLESLLEEQYQTAMAKEAEAKDRIRGKITVTEKGPQAFELFLAQGQLEVLVKARSLSDRDLTSLLVDAIGQGIRGIERDLPLMEWIDQIKHPGHTRSRKPLEDLKPIKLEPRKSSIELYALLRTMCPSWSRERLERLDISLPGLSDSIVAERHPEAHMAAALLQEARHCAKLAEEVAKDHETRGLAREARGALAVAAAIRKRHPEPRAQRNRT
jgi:hypothetical protein